MVSLFGQKLAVLGAPIRLAFSLPTGMSAFVVAQVEHMFVR